MRDSWRSPVVAPIAINHPTPSMTSSLTSLRDTLTCATIGLGLLISTLIGCHAAQAPATGDQRPESAPATAGDWSSLFNGVDLSGWKTHVWEDAPAWSVKDGVLRSTGGKGYLRTEQTFTNFELTLEARVSDSGTARGNSGVYIRSQPHANQAVEYPPAYEVQIDHGDGNNPTGSLYNRHKATPPSLKDGEWFRMRIMAVGPHIQVWINDQAALDVQDNTFPDGYIFLQQHHKTGVCEFRNIRIRRI